MNMTAKESKAVACPGLGDRLIFAEQGERAEAEVFRTRSIGFMEHTSRADLYAEARLALHAAEAELANAESDIDTLASHNIELQAELRELRRAARDYMEASDTLQQALRDGINVHGAISGFIGAQDNLQCTLASDGGADGDNEGEGK